MYCSQYLKGKFDMWYTKYCSFGFGFWYKIFVIFILSLSLFWYKKYCSFVSVATFHEVATWKLVTAVFGLLNELIEERGREAFKDGGGGGWWWWWCLHYVTCLWAGWRGGGSTAAGSQIHIWYLWNQIMSDKFTGKQMTRLPNCDACTLGNLQKTAGI